MSKLLLCATAAMLVTGSVFAGAAPIASSGAQCLRTGPVPLGAAVTAAERAAMPLATSGQAFVSVASARTVHVIDLATGERTAISAGIADAHEVAVSPDGRWGVAADFGDHLGNYDFDGRRLAVYDLREKKLARVIELGRYHGPHDVVFISPTRLVVTTQTSQHVVEVDVVAGTVLGATETRARGSHTLAVTPDARIAWTANQPEGTISRLDLSARRFVAKHDVSSGTIEGIAITPDGGEVWVGAGDQGAVLVIDGASGDVVEKLSGFRMPERMTMTSDGRLAVVTDFRCEVVQVVDVKTRRVLGPIAGLDGAGVAKVLPDNRTALILMLDEKVLVMADLQTRRVIARHELGGRRPDAAAWGPTP